MILEFTLFHGDAAGLPSDLIILKYAQASWGLDAYVTGILTAKGDVSETLLRPSPTKAVLVETKGLIAPRQALYVGTVPAGSLRYEEIHQLGRRAIEAIASHSLKAQHITTTIHGVGFGLDAGESAQSLTLGFLEGLRTCPSVSVRQITFADRDERNLRIIGTALEQMGIKSSPLNALSTEHYPVYLAPRKQGQRPGVSLTLGQRPRSKDHVFVAMPFAAEFQDVYEFGIYAPIRECGLICEKVDEASFTGDILERIRDRIRTAKLVVADLTGCRPNVYLEVGYAWGCSVPVVFLAREGETLHFDVKTHKCIYYKTIGQLARDLSRLIQDLSEVDQSGVQIAGEQAVASRVTVPIPDLLETRTLANVAVLYLPEALSGAEAVTLRHTVEHLMADGYRAMIFDMGRLQYCDSSGLGGLVGSASEMRKAGGTVRLASVPSGLGETLRITKLSTIVEMYETEEEAIASFRSSR